MASDLERFFGSTALVPPPRAERFGLADLDQLYSLQGLQRLADAALWRRVLRVADKLSQDSQEPPDSHPAAEAAELNLDVKLQCLGFQLEAFLQLQDLGQAKLHADRLWTALGGGGQGLPSQPQPLSHGQQQQLPVKFPLLLTQLQVLRAESLNQALRWLGWLRQQLAARDQPEERAGRRLLELEVLALERFGQPEAAARRIEAAAGGGGDESNPELRRWLGLCQLRAGNLAAGRASLQGCMRLLRAAPASETQADEQLCLEGLLRTAEHRYEEALVCFQRVLQRQPGHLLVANNVAVAAVFCGQVELAASCLEACIRADPYQNLVLSLIDNLRAVWSLLCPNPLELESRTRLLTHLVVSYAAEHVPPGSPSPPPLPAPPSGGHRAAHKKRPSARMSQQLQ